MQHAGLVNQTSVEMSFEISWASQICSQLGKGDMKPLQFLSPCSSCRWDQHTSYFPFRFTLPKGFSSVWPPFPIFLGNVPQSQHVAVTFCRVHASPTPYSPEKGTERSLDEPGFKSRCATERQFFLSEVTRKDVSSLWNILAVVLISSVSKTADGIPLYFFLQAEICHFSSITGCTKALEICSPRIQNGVTHKVPLQPPSSYRLFLQGN